MKSIIKLTINSQKMIQNIRNFSIIAHIDHGKTTLTDQFLRLTNTVSDQDFKERMMDSNPIEQERGVTIKLAPVRMNYQNHILNLIDTPGHVDFGYEVSRSLQACEGAVLLVDASQGVQAQTLAVYEKAKQQNLVIIPVINKIDLATADVETTILEMIDTFKLQEQEILLCSAKTGEGVEAVLSAVIDKVPPPSRQTGQSSQPSQPDQTSQPSPSQQPLRSLIITSKYDNHQGAIAYVRVVSGVLNADEELYLLNSDLKFQPSECGIFNPEAKATSQLTAGEVGYLATGLKDIEFLKIGDTVTTYAERGRTQPLPGFKEPTPMVFMELYPVENEQFADLKEAMDKLHLHDASLQFNPTHSQALGNGLRVGFLGIFHAEIVRERLSREFDLDLIATAPSVKYHVTTKNNQTSIIESPADLPDPSQINQILEPITRAMIFSPVDYLPQIIEFVRKRRGQLLDSLNTGTRSKLEFEIPLSELIIDFHDKLKSLTSGFASLEYEVADYQPVDAVKVDVLVNKEVVEALSFITTQDKAHEKGRQIVDKLKDVIPRQLFKIPVQAAIGGKIIAREDVKAYRKDVTAKLYGGDVTRRKKLLKKQSEGKKRLKKFGEVELNQEAFLAVLETD